MLQEQKRSSLVRFGSRAWRAVMWRVHLMSVISRRWIWDRLRTVDHEAKLRSSCVLDRVLPPLVAPGDPILSSSGIVPESLFTPVFVQDSREYVYHVRGPVQIEPRWGYASWPPFSVIDESVQYSEMTRSVSTAAYFSGLPALVDLFRRGGGVPVRKERFVVSLRFPFEPNYFHFLCDVLPRLTLALESGIPDDAVLLLDPGLRDSKWASEFLKRPSIGHLRVVYQGDYFVEAEEALFIQTSASFPGRGEATNKLLNSHQSDRYGDRRIFISRRSSDGRGINNMSDIAPILERFGVESIEMTDLTVSEQMETLRNCRLVVGIHGAGLANIVFRAGMPLTVIELFQPHSTPLYFYSLSMSLGYRYAYVVGDASHGEGSKASFSIDPGALSDRIEQEVERLG